MARKNQQRDAEEVRLWVLTVPTGERYTFRTMDYTTKYNVKHKPLSPSEVEKLSQMEYHHAYSYIIAESLKRDVSCEYLWMSAIKLLAGVDQK